MTRARETTRQRDNEMNTHRRLPSDACRCSTVASSSSNVLVKLATFVIYAAAFVSKVPPRPRSTSSVPLAVDPPSRPFCMGVDNLSLASFLAETPSTPRTRPETHKQINTIRPNCRLKRVSNEMEKEWRTDADAASRTYRVLTPPYPLFALIIPLSLA